MNQKLSQKLSQKLTVVMPTFKRTEMLALALEKLRACPESSQAEVRIHLDHSNEPHISEVRLAETEYVRDVYFPEAQIYQAKNHVLAPSGCWNILQSLKAGWEAGSEYVALVEEDCLVTPDFFQRHMEMQASGEYFVTSGRKLPYLPGDYYTNPGCCFRRDKLALVIPHINDAYFVNLTGYLDRHFGPMSDGGNLDDGLVRRVMRSVNGEAKTAVPSIVSHIGFHYYQKQPLYMNPGTIQERIAWLRTFLSDIPARKKADPRYIGDLEEI
jgi:hypothetical protein